MSGIQCKKKFYLEIQGQFCGRGSKVLYKYLHQIEGVEFISDSHKSNKLFFPPCTLHMFKIYFFFKPCILYLLNFTEKEKRRLETGK